MISATAAPANETTNTVITRPLTIPPRASTGLTSFSMGFSIWSGVASVFDNRTFPALIRCSLQVPKVSMNCCQEYATGSPVSALVMRWVVAAAKRLSEWALGDLLLKMIAQNLSSGISSVAIPAIDDGHPKAAWWHGVQPRCQAFVECNLQARYARHLPDGFQHACRGMPVVGVGWHEQDDAVSGAAP